LLACVSPLEQHAQLPFTPWLSPQQPARLKLHSMPLTEILQTLFFLYLQLVLAAKILHGSIALHDL
jgi:hypothetical protein